MKNEPHKDAFDEIYNEYFHDIYLYLMSLTRDEALAEDLTQEVFFRAMKSLNKFRGECHLRVWLCQIAKNEFFRYYGKAKRALPSDMEAFADSGESAVGSIRFEERLEDGETAFDLHKILHTLDEPYKEVFWLRTFGELSFRQIAALFGRSESWARVTYYRARLKIIEQFGQTQQGGNTE